MEGHWSDFALKKSEAVELGFFFFFRMPYNPYFVLLPTPRLNTNEFKVKSTTTSPISCALQVGSARETLFDLSVTINFSFSAAFLQMNVQQLPESIIALRGELLFC